MTGRASVYRNLLHPSGWLSGNTDWLLFSCWAGNRSVRLWIGNWLPQSGSSVRGQMLALFQVSVWLGGVRWAYDRLQHSMSAFVSSIWDKLARSRAATLFVHSLSPGGVCCAIHRAWHVELEAGKGGLCLFPPSYRAGEEHCRDKKDGFSAHASGYGWNLLKRKGWLLE